MSRTEPTGAGTRGASPWAERAASLGPGLMWAAAAVGVSHLVQSTRAGAIYGFGCVAIVVIANVLKYPLFEFGPRYAAATGESLVEGYRRQGRWVLALYIALTVATMFAVVAAVALVTGAVATQIAPRAGLSAIELAVGVLVVCAVIAAVGRYTWLDRLVKWIVLVLAVSTLAALVAAVFAAPPDLESGRSPVEPSSAMTFAFVIALVGWMPSAIDISVWQSLWTVEKARALGRRPAPAAVRFDFDVGYVGTALLSLAFLALGALVLHRSGVEVPAQAGPFAATLVEVYTASLGEWSRFVIVLAALTTMFSTTLTCVDAFPRALAKALTEIGTPRRPASATAATTGRIYRAALVVVVLGSAFVVVGLRGQLTRLVDLATTLSFLTGPLLGWFNYRAVTSDHMPAERRPSRALVTLARVSIASGIVFGAVFVGWRFFGLGAV